MLGDCRRVHDCFFPGPRRLKPKNFFLKKKQHQTSVQTPVNTTVIVSNMHVNKCISKYFLYFSLHAVSAKFLTGYEFVHVSFTISQCYVPL